MHSNGLLKWLMIPLALLLVFGAVKLFSTGGDTPGSADEASRLTPDEAKALVIQKATSDSGGDRGTDYGARPLRRAIEMYVEDPLSEELLRGVFQGKNLITVNVREVGDEKQFDFVGSVDESLGADGSPELAAAEAGTTNAE